MNDNRCSYCGKNMRDIPHKCKFCGDFHCSEHLLPEDHKCPGVKKYYNSSGKWMNVERLKKSKRRKKKSHSFLNDGIDFGPLPKKKKGHKSLNNKSKKLIKKTKRWLLKTSHRRYRYSRLKKYLPKILFSTAISIAMFIFFYSKINSFNEIQILILRLGSILLLVSLFFSIKYGLKVLKEIVNWFIRQQNWLKYTIVIAIILLAFGAYNNQEKYVNQPINYLRIIDYSIFNPLDIYETSEILGEISDTAIGAISSTPSYSVGELEKQMHELINQERIDNGLSALKWDDKIGKIARAHSDDMVTRDFYSHNNPDGMGPSDRGKKAGYSCSKSLGGGWYSDGLAENIAMTPLHSNVIGCGSTYGLENMATCVVDGWMGSPGHRENILTKTYDRAGMGVAFADNGEIYSTQNFC